MAQANVMGRTRTAVQMEGPKVTWGQNLLTVLFSLWLMIGLFVDGWAHTNIPELESFFTPWHGIFYSGYTATALWVIWLARRSGRKGLASIPKGYGLGVVGLAVFGAGGLADMTWHTLLGIEADIPALLSPPHMMLLTGALMTLTAPLRAFWLNEDVASDKPSFKTFLPALLSMTLTTALIAFFLTYEWAFRLTEPAFPGFNYQKGIPAMFLTNMILMLPLFFLMRRWKLPFGSATILFFLPTLLSNFFDVFRDWEFMIVALIAGLVTDLMVQKVQAPTAKPWEIRVFAALAPVVLWSLFYIAIDLKSGILWEFEAWSGSIIQTGLMTVGLSLLVFPLPLPERLRK